MGILLIVSIIAYRNKRRSNEQLRSINEEILRQQHLLEQQAVEIEISNNAFAEKNIELERSNDQLSALNMEKNEIMGIVAHDLKNPIGAVRGLAEIMQSGGLAPEQMSEITQHIVSTSERMLDLVKNLLDVNRLESGGMQFQRIQFSITPIIEATLAQYQDAAQKKNITIHFQSDTDSDLVCADEQATMQVLDNIISNAVKYSPHEKNIFVRIAKRIGESIEPSSLNPQTASYLQVSVTDEGPGISTTDMKKLFGKFARLSARPTGGEHSTGLGLSIVKRMVEAMDGRVWCESEPGKGATFFVEFPCS